MATENVADFPVITKAFHESEIHIHLLWDIHFGAAHCDYDLLTKAIEEIRKDPKAYFILGGDNMESISSSDWRAFSGKHDNYPKNMTHDETKSAIQKMRDLFVKQFEPIKHKGLAILEGNHEEKWGRGVDFELARELAILLGVPYGGYECGLVIKLRQPASTRDTYYAYHGVLSHGWGGGSLPGSKINRQQAWADQFDGIRFSVRGHSHDNMDSVAGRCKFFQRPDQSWAARIYDRLDIIAGSFMNGAYYTKKAGLRKKMTGWRVLKAKLVKNSRDHDKAHPSYYITQADEKRPY